MKVFKFGGASANSIERIKTLAEIVRSYKNEKMLIVISAMGKTTNALEKVVDAFYSGQKEEAFGLFNIIKENHLTTAKYLLVKNYLAAENQLRDFFTEVEWLLLDKPVRSYDYYYDQVVCVGELLSTTIISFYLNEMKMICKWIDVRDIFRTDDNFRDAVIDWKFTQKKVDQEVIPLFDSVDKIITQGFIGSTDENESTTLGREGSDYTAAVFANMLDAQSQTIWKDVEGVMNADPKQFPHAELISELDYDEVIEMAYYGAQVIHPKTIKPLQNKNIPLFVKCFLDSGLPGTVIQKKSSKRLPPIIVLKDRQVLMHLHSKDFSFVGESLTAKLYNLFAEIKIRPNLIQIGAVSLQICLDDRPDKIEKLALAAAEFFEVSLEKGLTLLTIRHYKQDTLKNLTEGKDIVLKQQSPQIVQVLMN
ncbi:MAG TPA: aspartate kinase [Puia sp.]|nr:aspartate kinase [Puia sp.]